MMLFSVAVVACIFHCYLCDILNIGALFEANENFEKAFNFAIETANKNYNGTEFEFAPIIRNNLTWDNPYSVMTNTCSIFDEGVIGIFGPKSLQNIAVVQSLCDFKEIPHIVTRWNYWSTRDDIMVNLYPHPQYLSYAYYQIISTKDWKSLTILYDDNESLVRVSSLIEDAQNDGIPVQIIQLDPANSGNYRTAMRKLKATEQTYIVLDCSIEKLFEVLSQIQQAGLMNERFSYLITNLDAHTENLMPFQYSNANITGIRLVDPEKEYTQKIAQEFFSKDTDLLELSAWKLTSETALVIDAMTMFTNSFIDRQKSSTIRIVAENNNSLQCDDTNSWEHGFSLVNMMKSYEYEGLTGQVKFDNQGFRSNFELTVFELLEGGITDVGTWSFSKGLNITRAKDTIEEEDKESLRNKSFVVQITLTEPYGMLKLTTNHLSGNGMYEGYAIDLIEKLAEMEGFNYTFIVREDKSNGAYDNKTKKWTGMIGDLLNNVSDLAICDFTITSDREEVVDFTDPFMTLGISILFRKAEKAPPSFFSFADPFGLDTWICLGVAFFTVSVALYFMGRLCADEWTNPYPCIEEPEFLVNQFSLSNALWFATGALLAQGSEIAPIAISTRMASGIWWYFCLIMSASYTANLACFLATENPIKLFTDLQSLYDNQHDIKYGAKFGGATVRYFMSAEEGTLLWKVGQHMLHHPEDLPKENDLGVARAEKEPFAFFMESSSIEYATQRHCTLEQYGDNLDQKGYGIAMRKGSPYRKRLSLAILKLQQNHFLDDLKTKWWEERRGGGACSGNEEVSEADPLGIKNVEGCFSCTVYGTCLAVVLVIFEHILYVCKVKVRTKTSLLKIFKLEWLAYINFNSPSKPNLMIDNKSETEEDSQKEMIEEEEKIIESKTKSLSPRSRSSSISRARLRYKRKSFLNGNSYTPQSNEYVKPESVDNQRSKPQPYGFVFPVNNGSVESKSQQCESSYPISSISSKSKTGSYGFVIPKSKGNS
ncbi:glutamate receptor ionotropic, kainate 2-like [Diorhabda carinulata]|uniref:glutamate receptor ionotropic, kainate 2-like n=1 Tax=Diorhabda carinulata TaxID=1163345 RepID=UPI0025A02FBF|nr:glutamate receptor ionotropic, kainate 2-like [Diorhabda carinulata]